MNGITSHHAMFYTTKPLPRFTIQSNIIMGHMPSMLVLSVDRVEIPD